MAADNSSRTAITVFVSTYPNVRRITSHRHFPRSRRSPTDGVTEGVMRSVHTSTQPLADEELRHAHRPRIAHPLRHRDVIELVEPRDHPVESQIRRAGQQVDRGLGDDQRIALLG
jgi:hypothetical protein